jgi:hypothetical protein
LRSTGTLYWRGNNSGAGIRTDALYFAGMAHSTGWIKDNASSLSITRLVSLAPLCQSVFNNQMLFKAALIYW